MTKPAICRLCHQVYDIANWTAHKKSLSHIELSKEYEKLINENRADIEIRVMAKGIKIKNNPYVPKQHSEI